MKKTSKSNADIRPDYDFSKGIRGKYVKGAVLGAKASRWDQQIERDVAAGKFNKIYAKVDKAFEANRCKPL